MIPNVKHPKAFHHKGVAYRTVSYFPLTDQQSQKIIRHALRNSKPKKSHQGSVLEIVTHIDRETLSLL